MPTLSAGDLVLLREHPHAFKEYLAVLRPGTILACRLNGVPGSDPATSLTYDNVTEGGFSSVVPGMTLWVGSAAGGRDKGTCRVRKSATADTLYIAEDSAIDWVDNDYLTVVENYELWMKYPRIVANGSLVFYKDWDVAYTDQHEDWPPVAVLGPPDCQFIDAGTGLATCLFVGEHSYPVAPGAAISTYAWGFPSGTPNTANTAGTDAAPHSITWDTAGIYWITLTVTDDNGKLHSGRRPVFIFPRTGANAPYTDFKISPRQGDLNQHGHAMQFEVWSDADQAEFPDGAMVVYFTEDWYGDTKKSIGGNYIGRTHIKFVGYIQKESTTKDPQTSKVTFDAATITSLMDSREGFSCWIKDKANATNWTEATNLTADRAALSLMRHHSTLLTICDVLVSGDTEYIKSQEFAAKTTLLQQLQTLYDDLFAHVACDKQGRLYCEIDPQMRSVGDRSSIPIICDLGHADWRDRLDLPRQQEAKTSFINLAGVHYPGSLAPVEPVLSKAPGDAPGYQGKTIEISGLILAGQSDGNEKAGLALARENNEFPDITVPMPGLWDVFDIVPQEYVRLSLAAEDTKRGIVWTNQKLIPRRVELAVEQTKTGRIPKVTIHVEKDSFGPSGVDGDYPSEVPEPSPPLIPPAPAPPPLPPGGTPGDGNHLYMLGTSRLYDTPNAWDPTPGAVVYRDNGQIDGGGAVYWLALDSFKPKEQAMVAGQQGIYKTVNLDSLLTTWEKVVDLYDPGEWALWAHDVKSSICQNGLWMVTVLDYTVLPSYRDLYVYWSTNFGESWNSKRLTRHASYYKAYVECSSHDSQRAWVTYLNGSDGLGHVCKTTDQWSTFSDTALSSLTGYNVPYCYHRFYENLNDNVGLYVNRNKSQICSADYSDCTVGTISSGLGSDIVNYAGGYTWGTGGFWCLTSKTGGLSRFHVSDDGYTWTIRKSWPWASGAAYSISGWPWEEDWVYAGMHVNAPAPLEVSIDRGQTWAQQTGNWGDLTEESIRCLVPVWLE